jgi:hypothetical protein
MYKTILYKQVLLQKKTEFLQKGREYAAPYPLFVCRSFLFFLQMIQQIRITGHWRENKKTSGQTHCPEV